MLYLVTGEWVEAGALVPPEQMAGILETTVVPSLEIWERWEQEGRIKGGVFAGERAGAFVLEAASHEEVGELLSSLPFWGLVKWQVKPLQSARSTIERDRRVIERLRVGTG